MDLKGKLVGIEILAASKHINLTSFGKDKERNTEITQTFMTNLSTGE